MIPLDVLALFFSASVALAIAPGPDNIFVLTQSALHGRLAGLVITLGLASGLIFHTTAAAFGVAVLIQTSDLAFSALKFAGAAYLLWLAWQAFTARPTGIDGAPAPQAPPAKLYLRGLIMNIANPKVTIFILAFLPQFIAPDQGPVIAQFYILGALMFLATLLVFGAIALAAGSIGAWLNSTPAAQLWLNRLSGAVFVALALKLALSSRT